VEGGSVAGFVAISSLWMRLSGPYFEGLPHRVHCVPGGLAPLEGPMAAAVLWAAL